MVDARVSVSFVRRTEDVNASIKQARRRAYLRADWTETTRSKLGLNGKDHPLQVLCHNQRVEQRSQLFPERIRLMCATPLFADRGILSATAQNR